MSLQITYLKHSSFGQSKIFYSLTGVHCSVISLQSVKQESSGYSSVKIIL